MVFKDLVAWIAIIVEFHSFRAVTQRGGQLEMLLGDTRPDKLRRHVILASTVSLLFFTPVGLVFVLSLVAGPASFGMATYEASRLSAPSPSPSPAAPSAIQPPCPRGP